MSKSRNNFFSGKSNSNRVAKKRPVKVETKKSSMAAAIKSITYASKFV